MTLIRENIAIETNAPVMVLFGGNPERMNEVDAEKFESTFFVFTGINAIILACYFIFVLKKPFQNGIAFSIAAIALIQIVAWTSVYFYKPQRY